MKIYLLYELVIIAVLEPDFKVRKIIENLFFSKKKCCLKVSKTFRKSSLDMEKLFRFILGRSYQLQAHQFLQNPPQAFQDHRIGPAFEAFLI